MSMSQYSNKELQHISYEIKKTILIMLNYAKSGHTGGALGLSEIFTVLYSEILNINPKNYKSKNRDYLFLSNGHTCPVLYATLSYFNFFEQEESLTLRQLDSRLQGHPHYNHNNETLPGVENSGGPLGQGISQAVGLAAALKRDDVEQSKNSKGKKNKIFCIIGDGECEEGQVWESIMFASKEKLDNLVIIVDKNNIQIDGTPKEVLNLDNLVKKFQSFGCSTTEFNGNSIEQIKIAIEHSLKIKGKPHVLIADTIPGYGVSFIENKVEWHGKSPNDDELEQAILEINNNIKLL